MKLYHIGTKPARKFCLLCNLIAMNDYSEGAGIGHREGGA